MSNSPVYDYQHNVLCKKPCRKCTFEDDGKSIGRSLKIDEILSINAKPITGDRLPLVFASEDFGRGKSFYEGRIMNMVPDMLDLLKEDDEWVEVHSI